jgi:hypothetical protein
MKNDWQGSNGFWFKYESGNDYVDVVGVTCCNEADGANNVYLVESGSIYFSPRHFDSALDSIGWNCSYGPPQLPHLVDGFNAYHGMGRDSMNGETYIQHGYEIDGGHEGGLGMGLEADYILRKNMNLSRFIQSEFLR